MYEIKKIILMQENNLSTGLPMENKTVSAMDFYAFRFMVRDNEFNPILKSKELFHQFAVDMYAKIEAKYSFTRCFKDRGKCR